VNASIERVGGATKGVWLSAHQVAAYSSLAASRGVEFTDVVRAAEDGRLRDVVEVRDIGRERRIAEQSAARINAHYRRRVLQILSERHIGLLERELF
jgi:hypothetical protein